MAGRLRTLKFVGLLAITASCFTPAAQKLASTPTELNMAAGDTVSLPIAKPHQAPTSSNHAVATTSETTTGTTVKSNDPGNFDIASKLFGFIPWKTHVHVTPGAKVVVGGQAVGIRLESKGPVVVGFRRLSDGSSPSARAHVQIGDMIVSIEQHAVHSSSDLQQVLRQAPQQIHLTIQRGHTKRQLSVNVPDDGLGHRQLGLYVRDRTVGVGTLTFYDPVHHAFGALGHVITDIDTGQRVDGSGQLYEAMITGLKRGQIGAPGEKRGTFSSAGTQSQIGLISENTDYGVFGSMPSAPLPYTPSSLVQVALPEQVHEGPAKMYTVVHGNKVEAFDVRVDNVAHQHSPATKSMIIKVTDPRLLAETGGIIQGMSGSPLLQDGRLIGAVTHVFVSDPTRGYGVYAMWMLQQTRDEHAVVPSFSPWLMHPAWNQPRSAV
jgi:stage IV sporulation protein B